jgi:hypothetical protein
MLVGVLGTSCSPDEALQKPEQVVGNSTGTFVSQSIPYRVVTTNWKNLPEVHTAALLVINDAQTLESYLDEPTVGSISNPYSFRIDFDTETLLLAYATVPYITKAKIASYEHYKAGFVMTVETTVSLLPAFSDWRVAIIVPKVNAGDVSLTVI